MEGKPTYEASLFLFLQDPRQYFDSQQANGMYAQGEKRDFRTAEHFNLDETYDSLANVVSRIGENGLKDPIMNPQLAVKVLLKSILWSWRKILVNHYWK